MREALAKLMAKEDLSSEEMRRCMQKMMAGEATPAQIGSFLTAMRLKGETVAEIAACAQVMREMAAPMPAIDGPLVDTCGTGGDGRNTFNISTAAAFVVAGAGLPVAKHGNRAAVEQMRQRRRAGRFGRADRQRASRSGRRHPPGGDRLFVRPGVSQRDAPRRRPPSRDRISHLVQFDGAPYQSRVERKPRW